MSLDEARKFAQQVESDPRLDRTQTGGTWSGQEALSTPDENVPFVAGENVPLDFGMTGPG